MELSLENEGRSWPCESSSKAAPAKAEEKVSER